MVATMGGDGAFARIRCSPGRRRRGRIIRGGPTVAAFDVVGVGVAAVDDIAWVEAYPPADAKVRVTRRERHPGGLTATALVAAARLGARCAYAGILGEDEDSLWVLEHLAAEGIETRYATRLPGAGPVRSIIIVGTDRHTRNVFSDASRVLDLPGEPDEAALGDRARAAVAGTATSGGRGGGPGRCPTTPWGPRASSSSTMSTRRSPSVRPGRYAIEAVPWSPISRRTSRRGSRSWWSWSITSSSRGPSQPA